jgi:tetratricopeptide (TPR) repeat protein
MRPLFVRIPVQSFDTGLLPPEARRIGSPQFKDAVIRHFVTEYHDKGETVLVTVDDSDITVQSLRSGPEAMAPVLELLNAGRIREALPMLESLAERFPDDVDVRYNLGIALSELGRFEEAIAQLKAAVSLEPNHSRALTGIGVAQARLHRTTEALEALNRAVAADPGDGYAHRNLGAVLSSQKKFDEALPHFREALHQLPDDPQAIFGLAQCLEALGPDHLAEADRLYVDLITRFPASPVADSARQARTRIAQASLRGAVGGGVRMDVVMYIAGAIEKFKELGPRKRQEIALEIALLGQRGLDVNDPSPKYSLRTLPGSFSGLHLLAIMYAAFRQIDPTLDSGADFSREYEMAQTFGK